MTKNLKILLALALIVFLLTGVVLWLRNRVPTDTTTSVTSSPTSASIDQSMSGKYFEPHGAVHYIILNPDHTFVHNRIDSQGQAHLVEGTYSVTGSTITFTYDDGFPSLQLTIAKQPPDTRTWYITGTVAGVTYYFVQED